MATTGHYQGMTHPKHRWKCSELTLWEVGGGCGGGVGEEMVEWGGGDEGDGEVWWRRGEEVMEERGCGGEGGCGGGEGEDMVERGRR